MLGAFLRQIYTGLFYLATPFVILRLLYKAHRSPLYARRIKERFGFLPKRQAIPSIWIHAVSLGEVIAATPFIQAIKERYPDKALVLTSLTPTGSTRVKEVFGKDVYHVYAPYDLPLVLRRFFKIARPTCVILIETELWPNLFARAHHSHVPVFVANARLSSASVRGYQKIRPLVAEMLRRVTMVAAQSQIDADRYLSLGLRPEKLTIVGSMKFDMDLPASLFEKAIHIRQVWGVNRSVWIAASTHEGEEEILLQAFDRLRQEIPNSLLVLVPRHPERFTKAQNLCRKHGYSVVLRSSGIICDDKTDVFIGDTIGELCAFYAASDIALVGGSLIDGIGGHNPLEPAACGVPILMGPHTFNFLEINRLLQEAGAVKTVQTVEECAQTIIALWRDPEQQEQMRIQGKKVVARNRGALQKHLCVLETILHNVPVH